MRDTLSHRGPDDAGQWISDDGAIGLAQRRLSILDLSPRGHQPMSAGDGEVWIVYNGEVYNFRQLRAELSALGVPFVTDTDTEVILQAYRQWGIACLDRLEGMFAFALYDRPRRTLHLVRDRLGIKPLFYAVDGGVLRFGSEIRAIRAADGCGRSLDRAAAVDYFSTGYVPCPATIWQGIRKLPPGHRLTFADAQASEHVWWRPQPGSVDMAPQAARQRLAELVDAAVTGYLVSDVAVGSYLSGGLDSTIVTERAAREYSDGAAGKRIGGTTLHTFSMGFDVAEHTELHYAREAAQRYGTAHRERIVTREMAHGYDERILGLFDEPFAASSTIPMTFLAEMAREATTVCLCGEGGDEVFGGYSWYLSWLRFRRPSFWATPAGRATRWTLEGLIRRPKRKWRLPALDDVDLYAQLMGAVSAADKRRIFHPDLLGDLGERDEAAAFRRHWRADLDPMTRMQVVDLMTFLPDLNLTRADRTSMRVGLELRVPLLHHELVEFCIGLPPEVRTPGGRLKGLFREAMDDRLPEAIRTRKKKGFSAPVREWFDSAQMLGLVAQVRAERPQLAASWLHPQLERYAARVSGSRAYKLWVFLQWLRRYAP